MQDYKTIRSVEEIDAYLGNATVVAFDFETAATDEYRDEDMSALDAHKADIAGISVSVAAGTARYIPLRHRVGQNADVETVMAYLRSRLFNSSRIVKIAHNLSFEAMFLYKYGIVIQEPVYDTIVAAQLTLKNDYEFRDLSDSGLKTLVPYLYGVALPTFEEVVKGRFFDELDPDEWNTCRYACADSDWTLQLYHTFNEWFDYNIPRHRFICEEIESPTAVYTGMMKYNGVGVDAALMEKKRLEAEQKIMELREKVLMVTGDIDIGTNCSTAAFKAFLYTPNPEAAFHVVGDAKIEGTVNAQTVTAASLSGTLPVSNVSGTLPISKGGTGATTAAAAITNIINGRTIAPQVINVTGSRYWIDGIYGINMQNSDIIGINGLYFLDAVDSEGEGINFYRSSTTWDRLYSYAGTLYYAPNVATNTHPGTRYTVYHSGGATIPISKGGTGATTAAAARTNLGITCTSLYSGSLSSGSTTFNYGNYKAYIIVGNPTTSASKMSIIVPKGMITTSDVSWQIADEGYFRVFKLKYSGTTVTMTIGNGYGSITNVYGIN